MRAQASSNLLGRTHTRTAALPLSPHLLEASHFCCRAARAWSLSEPGCLVDLSGPLHEV